MVQAIILFKDFEVMQCILKSSARGLSLPKEGSVFSVTKEYGKLTGSKGSTESSLVDIYMSIRTEVVITAGIRSIALIEISIDIECDL